MADGEQVRLGAVQETLFTPLAGRARETRKKRPPTRSHFRPEGAESSRDAGWVLHHPPVPETIEDFGTGTCPGCGSAAHLLGAHEVILGPDDGEAGTLCRSGEVTAQLGHGRLGGGAVKREDCPAHVRTLSGSQFLCNRHADASGGHALEALVERSPHQIRNRLLADPGRLPYPGEVMPGIMRVEYPQGSRWPRSAAGRALPWRRKRLCCRPRHGRRGRPARRVLPAPP